MPLTPNSFAWMSPLRHLPGPSNRKCPGLNPVASASNCFLLLELLAQGQVHHPHSCVRDWDSPSPSSSHHLSSPSASPLLSTPITAHQVHLQMFLKSTHFLVSTSLPWSRSYHLGNRGSLPACLPASSLPTPSHPFSPSLKN